MTMHVTLRQLRAFLAVVDAGSFSEAAKVMNLSQAALSGLIRELEDRVGVRLLDRNTRSVSLSSVGQSFEPMSRRVLSTLEEALDSLTDLKELRRGVVRVAAPEPLSCTLMPDLIARYQLAQQGIEVRFEDVPIEQVLAGLQQGSMDVGFGPAGIIEDEMVEEHHLWPDPMCVALHPDDPLSRQDAVSWKDLRDRPLINYMPNFATHVLSHVPPRNHPRKILPVHRVNTALSMLRVGEGAVVSPALTERLVLGFGLCFLPLKQPQVNWQAAMFVRRRPSVSPAVESFVQFALDFVGPWAATSNRPKGPVRAR
jgi:DNA-binding transcriptional LysR family regulator